MNITVIGDQATISTVDIAALVGKQHRNVLRDARKMLKEIDESHCSDLSSEANPNLDRPPRSAFDGMYINERGQNQPCLYLPKREATILLTGYDTRKRALIVDRLIALEAAFAEAQIQALPPPEPKMEIIAPDLPRDLFDHRGGMIERATAGAMSEIKRLGSSIWKVKNELQNALFYRLDVSDKKSTERDRYLAKQALAVRGDVKTANDGIEKIFRYLTREPNWITMREFIVARGVADALGLVPRLSKEAEGYFTARLLRLEVATPKTNLKATQFESSHLDQWWKAEGEELYRNFLRKRSAPVVQLVPKNEGEPK